MGGAFTGFILLGIGTLYGALLTGAFRASDRAARHGRYIRMPGQHRHTTRAVKISAAIPAWDGSDQADTILPGAMPAIGETT